MSKSDATLDYEGFLELLGSYDAIALIANSESLVIDSVMAALPQNTLYVFFTGCAKVLSKPFPKDSILCHRLVAEGTRFLKSRKHFESAYSFFPQGLKAEVGILADKAKTDRGPLPAPRTSPITPLVIDFDYMFHGLYPAGRMPTTGFALALSLLDLRPETKVYLCGFTGVPGTEFNMYSEHDWTFEQTVLQLFAKKERIIQLQESDVAAAQNWLTGVSNRFPEFAHGEVAMMAAQVIGNRLTGTERRVAKLWDQTKWQRKIKAYFKRFRKK